ncbi:MAG: PorP/SprF family type IX secretion system membrane protein [Candidatus Azobacteroides sp.]|nr:PorP/SprF family type IX secretion system membrane protein [Candidatus Azobacteroides sp.]
MRKLAVFIVGMFLLASSAEAQFDAQFSQYWVVENYYNPAKAGSERNKLNLTGLYRMQWIGMPGAPKTIFVTGEAGLDFFGRTHGVGASFFSEKIGLYSLSTVSLQYAFKLKLLNGVLSMGLEAGLGDLAFDGSGLYTPQGNEYHNATDDGILNTDVKGSRLNVNFGVRYATEHYYAGFSSTKLTEPMYDYTDLVSTYIGRIYYLTAGGNITLNNPLYQFRPSFLVKTDFLSTQIDVTARVLYNEMFWGGVSYRWKEALIFSIGANIRNIQAGYAYDHSMSAIGGANSGCHEFTLTYTVDLNFSKNNRYRYKSVRIL